MCIDYVMFANLKTFLAREQCQISFWCEPILERVRGSAWGMPLICKLAQARARLLLLSHSVVSHSLWSHGLQHARIFCPSFPGACSNSYPSSQWCHPTISSSVVPFSSRLQSFSASGSFPISQLFGSGGRSIGVSASASVLPMNSQVDFL